jgi:RNA processing factor Prp31
MNQKDIISLNINESKRKIKKELGKDNLIIFFTRIIEDIQNSSNPDISRRIKDIYQTLNPYLNISNLKQIINQFKLQNFSEEGLSLTDQEKYFLTLLIKSLNDDGTLQNPQILRGRLNGILKTLSETYLPNSSKHIEPYMLGKLISFFSSTQNLAFKPASTIQIIGAEKAMFNHFNENRPTPKYGLLYRSKNVQQSKNKPKAARQLSNKLAISLKQDYFTKIKNE